MDMHSLLCERGLQAVRTVSRGFLPEYRSRHTSLEVYLRKLFIIVSWQNVDVNNKNTKRYFLKKSTKTLCYWEPVYFSVTLFSPTEDLI